MKRLAMLAVALGAAVAAAGNVRAEPASKNSGTIVEYKAMASAFIPPADVAVWLPPGYETGDGRYAVLYMHDGQNLFDLSAAPPSSSDGKKWGVDTRVAALMAKGVIRPTIVVGIAHMGPARIRQYLPQGVYDRLSDSDRRFLDTFNGGKPFSDDYLRFLVKELKPFVDRTYRTEPGPGATFAMGSSMGGLISLYAVAEYPEIFGGAGCLSTHWNLPLFYPGRPEFSPAVLGAFREYIQAKLPPPGTHRIWFDHGTVSLDADYGRYQERIDRKISSLGWRAGKDFASRVYPGATHNEGAWRERLADPLIFLLGTKTAD